MSMRFSSRFWKRAFLFCLRLCRMYSFLLLFIYFRCLNGTNDWFDIMFSIHIEIDKLNLRCCWQVKPGRHFTNARRMPVFDAFPSALSMKNDDGLWTKAKSCLHYCWTGFGVGYACQISVSVHCLAVFALFISFCLSLSPPLRSIDIGIDLDKTWSHLHFLTYWAAQRHCSVLGIIGKNKRRYTEDAGVSWARWEKVSFCRNSTAYENFEIFFLGQQGRNSQKNIFLNGHIVGKSVL